MIYSNGGQLASDGGTELLLNQLAAVEALQVLRHVIVPLSRPALITVGIFSSLFEWNDFLRPLIYLNDSRRFTLALGLAEFTGIYTSQWHLRMAAATVVIAPVLILILILFAQRYFIKGSRSPASRRKGHHPSAAGSTRYVRRLRRTAGV